MRKVLTLALVACLAVLTTAAFAAEAEVYAPTIDSGTQTIIAYDVNGNALAPPTDHVAPAIEMQEGTDYTMTTDAPHKKKAELAALDAEKATGRSTTEALDDATGNLRAAFDAGTTTETQVVIIGDYPAASGFIDGTKIASSSVQTTLPDNVRTAKEAGFSELLVAGAIACG